MTLGDQVPEACQRSDRPIALPGESGTSPYSIAATLPEPLTRHNAAIIYGHGVFTTGQYDFRDAFQRLLDIEQICFDTYFDRIQKLQQI